MKVLLGRAADQPATLKKIRSVAPPANIKVHGVYFLFGRYNGALLFEASDLKSAKDFILRAVTPVYKPETLTALPAEGL